MLVAPDALAVLAAVLAPLFGLASWALAGCEADVPLEEVELSLFCPVAPGTASAQRGASAIITLSTLASQRVPIGTGFGGVGLGETATFIPQLYDELHGSMQPRTTTVNGEIPTRDSFAWFPPPRSSKLRFQVTPVCPFPCASGSGSLVFHPTSTDFQPVVTISATNAHVDHPTIGS